MYDRIAVGRRIKGWMVDKGLSAEDFATELSKFVGQDISVTTLRSWLYGTRTLSLERSYNIAEFFGKSLDDLAVRDRAKAKWKSELY